jgi:DNA polymerase (family 10)
LKGIESDVLTDGSLNYPDNFLDRFDFVVASIHGRFKLDRELRQIVCFAPSQTRTRRF